MKSIAKQLNVEGALRSPTALIKRGNRQSSAITRDGH
jgi:hypothetical protein